MKVVDDENSRSLQDSAEKDDSFSNDNIQNQVSENEQDEPSRSEDTQAPTEKDTDALEEDREDGVIDETGNIFCYNSIILML